jgi:hypothetical protein
LAIPSAQVKNGDKQLCKLKFHATNEASACTHEGSSYFLCGKWGKNFLLFSHVMFPICSCKVPQGFPRVPKLFPKRSLHHTFFPDGWFAQS